MASRFRNLTIDCHDEFCVERSQAEFDRAKQLPALTTTAGRTP